MILRVFYILIVLLTSCGSAFSQSAQESEYWYQMITNESVSSQTILSAVNSAAEFSNNQDTSEGSDQMVAIRFQNFWQNRTGSGNADNNSLFFAADKAVEDFYYSKDHYLKTSSSFNNEWNYIGRDSAETHTMGIVYSLAIDTSSPDLKTIYAGTNASGLWKTTDGGENWYNTSDNLYLPCFGINDVVIDPNNSDILYICTGVTTFQRAYGIGIWKSIDAGLNWNKIWGNGNTNQLAQKLLIAPNQSSNLFALIDDKIFRSKNGGNDWHLVFDKIYQPHNWKTRRILEAVFKPGSDDTLYIISEGTQSTVQDYNPELWQCFNASSDSLIWTRIDDSLNWQYTQRASIAVSEANPELLYCGFSYNDRMNYCLFCYNATQGIWYKKIDTIAEDFFQGVDKWRNELIVSPTDTNVIYVGGFYVSKINDDSISQSGLFHSEGFHVDVRNMRITKGSSQGSGGNEDIIFVANDGGISKTIDGANTWESINGRGLRITQYYDLATSSVEPGLYAGGTQDNGLIIHNPNLTKPWNIHFEGDNYSTVIDHTNPDNIYSLLFDYAPGLLVTNDGGVTAEKYSEFPADEYVTHGWPLVMDPNQSGTLYTGLRDSYKSVDFANTWDKISDFTLPPHTLDSNQKIEDLRVFRLDNNVIYIAFAGSTNSIPGKKLFKTNNGGQSWVDVSGNLSFLEYYGITSVDIHPNDHNRVWLSLGGFSDADTLKVIYTDDSFNTYTDISEGLPNFPVNCIKVNNTPLNELFLCNDLAVYYRNDTMSHWEKYGIGLPVCIVSDIEIDQERNQIKIATFGRGLWEIDGTGTGYSISDDEVINNINIFPNPASNEITIQSSTCDHRASIFIYDIFGRQKAATQLPEGQKKVKIDVCNYSPGVYVAVIDGEKGRKVQIKFVISR